MRTEHLSTRALAAHTLDRVTRHSAYSNVVINNAVAGTDVDRGLYYRLVYETLRHLEGVDEAIASATPRPLDRIQAEVLAVVRIGTAELRYLGRPSHSAVSESVEAVRELGRPKASGFVNGVLRNVARTLDAPVAADETMGMPRWIYDRLGEIFGDERDSFINSSNLAAATGVRSRDGTSRGSHDSISGAGYVDHDTELAGLVASGAIDIIDPASVAVVNALGIESGDIVLDLAAAPGGKTRAMADATAPSGLVVACDIHPRRLASARKRSADLVQIEWLIADAASPPFKPGVFDRVLLDAPCTGLGTLRRRPEIRYRLEPDAPQRYGVLQRALLESALDLVREGGRLVYSVCTVFPEETLDVVAGLGAQPPEDTPGIDLETGTLLAPHVTGTDGMFIAVFDR